VSVDLSEVTGGHWPGGPPARREERWKNQPGSLGLRINRGYAKVSNSRTIYRWWSGWICGEI